MLLSKASASQRQQLATGYNMLTSLNEMGERYKFLALLEKGAKNYIPPGFVALS